MGTSVSPHVPPTRGRARSVERRPASTTIGPRHPHTHSSARRGEQLSCLARKVVIAGVPDRSDVRSRGCDMGNRGLNISGIRARRARRIAACRFAVASGDAPMSGGYRPSRRSPNAR